VTAELVRRLTEEELRRIADQAGPRFRQGRFAEATVLFERVALATDCPEFLTLPAYDMLDDPGTTRGPS
jgi:malate synthase